MTADRIHRFLVAYDVTDDPRRFRLAKLLQSYGDRIQYSIFLIDAKPAKLVRLRATMRMAMDVTQDSVLICDLGPIGPAFEGRLQIMGRERTITSRGPMIL